MSSVWKYAGMTVTCCRGEFGRQMCRDKKCHFNGIIVYG